MSTIKANRWAWIVSGIVLSGGMLVLGFMLVLATQNSDRFERHFGWLVTANIAIAAFLTLIIVFALGRLAVRLRSRKFGSRLLLKLAGIFGVLALVPGLMIYTVSYQFVSRSIETWFDVRVEGALEAGLNLGRSTLDTLTQDLASKTRVAASRLSEQTEPLPHQPSLLELERIREQLGAHTVSFISESGQVELSAGGDGTRLLSTERMPQAWRTEARSKGVLAQVEGLDDRSDASTGVRSTQQPSTHPPARIVALAWMPDSSFSLQAHGHFLMVTQQLAPDLVRNALAVQAAYQEYQERSLSRTGLRRMYIGTLTLALVLAVFGAFLMAAIMGQQLARPLLMLAEGVQEVASGDLRPKAIFASRDELGGLTRSFADMTQQLADARTLAERSVQELDSARAHLQTVLDNMSAGVIVFNASGTIDMVNPGATRILRLPMSAYRGRALSDISALQGIAESVKQRFDLVANDPTPGERLQWQEAYELQLPHQTEPLTLLVRGAELPLDGQRLIVFDDLTEMVSAQRAEAWSEVARRVAHEIKNPLTPIQLSAERLQIKLEDKLDEPSQQLLTRSVNTIVTQVQALKNLINEFRDYARLPTAKLLPLDLNTLVNDVLALYGNAVEQGTIQLALKPDMPAIMGDAALLRQVVHNLVQNALDAANERKDGTVAQVTLRTDTPLNDDGSIRAVRLTVRDNGLGFPDKVFKRAFEPYITTKPKGTGLGLAVVKKIADEHKALVRIRNLQVDLDLAAAQGYPAASGPFSGAQVSLSFSVLSSHPT